jgi:Rhodopirellula transposase DDE domain
VPETDAIFENLKSYSERPAQAGVQRISMDCKATVKLGEYSRGGETRGDNQALDHDMGQTDKAIPCGIVNEDSGALFLGFGSSSKTSDFIVDNLKGWWGSLTPQQQQETETIQIKVDNGPESSGVRTQFLSRAVDWADQIGKTLHLLYFPPYHSKYNPIERCWGILELHWNGAKLLDWPTVLAWAKSMTWKGAHPIVYENQQSYQTGISLSKVEMRPIEKRLERNPTLPKWDIWIRPKLSVPS